MAPMTIASARSCSASASNSCHVESEGRPSFYGGNDNADNSGILRYVVVKHPGFEVAPGDELGNHFVGQQESEEEA